MEVPSLRSAISSSGRAPPTRERVALVRRAGGDAGLPGPLTLRPTATAGASNGAPAPPITWVLSRRERVAS